jgi:hypothetical protein
MDGCLPGRMHRQFQRLAIPGSLQREKLGAFALVLRLNFHELPE